MQGFLVLSQTKINHFRKLNTLKEIKQFAKNLPTSQPLNEQELAAFKPIFKTQKRKQCTELAQILQQKQSQQKKAQQEFLRSITQQYQQDKMKQLLSVINMERILNRKVAKQIQDGLTLLNKKSSPQKPNEKIVKNILTSTFMMVSIKLKLLKQHAFKTLLKQFGFGSIADQFATNMKLKGKALLALKEYPRMNLKRAFWRWHLSTTDQGEKLFKRASDKLVLYTNINKTSFFYRLYNQVRAKQIKIDPKVKRMTVMFYLYTKIFFQRPMRTFFEKTKIFTAGSGKQFQAVENIINNSKMREKDVFKKWFNKGKQMRDKEKLKKAMIQKLAKKIVQVSKQKKQYFIEEWKRVTQEKIKSNKLKTLFLTKLLSTKSGRVAQAFNNWKMLPQKVNLQAFKRISRFEKGLVNFAQRTVKKALQSFISEYEKAQAEKKRAVIQLINATQGRQKKYFNKWKGEILQHTLYQRCQMLTKVFQNMKNTLDRNFSHIYQTRQYNLRQVSILQRFFKNANDKIDEVMQEIFERLKENAKFSRINKWFYKAAQTFAIRSHITMQKSLWRLKINALGKVYLCDDLIKNKLQKMCGNMREYYKLILYRAFITLTKFGISQQKLSIQITKSTNDLTQKISHNKETHNLREEGLWMTNKKASVNLCENVFNQNMSKQLNLWRYNVCPGKKFIESSSIISKYHPEIDQYINQSKACMLIFEKLFKKRLLNISFGYRIIAKYLKKAPQIDTNKNLEQRFELTTQQSRLMEKIQEYKKQNEALLQQLEDKQLHLEESNNTVKILSIRINYMVMQKFLSLVGKVVEGNIWRCMNQGFDCIIEMANQNFDKEHANNSQIQNQ